MLFLRLLRRFRNRSQEWSGIVSVVLERLFGNAPVFHSRATRLALLGLALLKSSQNTRLGNVQRILFVDA